MKIIGKSGYKVSAKDQVALKRASAKRLAEQEALRSPKKANMRFTGITPAAPPKTATEIVLAAMGGW